MPFALTPLTFGVALAMGGISAMFAHKRGRNPYTWFLIGFLFGLVGIIAVFFIPPKKAAPRRRTTVPKPTPKLSGPIDKFWYYLDPSHAQQGPMSFNALSRAFGEGKISSSTYVWYEDLPDWRPLQEFITTKP